MDVEKIVLKKDTMPTSIGIRVNGIEFMTPGILPFLGKEHRDKCNDSLDSLIRCLEEAGHEVN